MGSHELVVDLASDRLTLYEAAEPPVPVFEAPFDLNLERRTVPDKFRGILFGKEKKQLKIKAFNRVLHQVYHDMRIVEAILELYFRDILMPQVSIRPGFLQVLVPTLWEPRVNRIVETCLEKLFGHRSFNLFCDALTMLPLATGVGDGSSVNEVPMEQDAARLCRFQADRKVGSVRYELTRCRCLTKRRYWPPGGGRARESAARGLIRTLKRFKKDGQADLVMKLNIGVGSKPGRSYLLMPWDFGKAKAKIRFEVQTVDGILDVPVIGWLEQDDQSRFLLERFVMDTGELNQGDGFMRAELSAVKKDYFTLTVCLTIQNIDRRMESDVALPMLVR